MFDEDIAAALAAAKTFMLIADRMALYRDQLPVDQQHQVMQFQLASLCLRSLNGPARAELKPPPRPVSAEPVHSPNSPVKTIRSASTPNLHATSSSPSLLHMPQPRSGDSMMTPEQYQAIRATGAVICAYCPSPDRMCGSSAVVNPDVSDSRKRRCFTCIGRSGIDILDKKVCTATKPWYQACSPSIPKRPRRAITPPVQIGMVAPIVAPPPTSPVSPTSAGSWFTPSVPFMISSSNPDVVFIGERYHLVIINAGKPICIGQKLGFSAVSSLPPTWRRQVLRPSPIDLAFLATHSIVYDPLAV